MSLGEIHQVYEVLIKIDELLSDVEAKSATLEKNLPTTQKSVLTVQEAIRLTWRFTHLLSHLGLPENVEASINKITRLMYATRMLYTSLMLLSATTPYGLVMGGIGAVLGGLSLAEMVSGY